MSVFIVAGINFALVSAFIVEGINFALVSVSIILQRNILRILANL